MTGQRSKASTRILTARGNSFCLLELTLKQFQCACVVTDSIDNIALRTVSINYITDCLKCFMFCNLFFFCLFFFSESDNLYIIILFNYLLNIFLIVFS